MKVLLLVGLLAVLAGCDGSTSEHPPGYGVTPIPRHDTIEHSHAPQKVK